MFRERDGNTSASFYDARQDVYAWGKTIMRAHLAAIAIAAVAMMGTASQAAETGADAHFKALYTKEWTWREHEFAGADDEDNAKPSDHLPAVDKATQDR